MSKINKVVFVADRIALTKQTSANYQAYDPDANSGLDVQGVKSTESTRDLKEFLKRDDNGIIITSFQKLATLVKPSHKNHPYKPPKQNILFIVDEAHRSTSGESFEDIQKAFKGAA